MSSDIYICSYRIRLYLAQAKKVREMGRYHWTTRPGPVRISMLLRSISSQFWALNGLELGINRSKSVKKWHFRGVRPIAEIRFHQELRSTPNGIRTRAATLKGWMMSPMNECESSD